MRLLFIVSFIICFIAFDCNTMGYHTSSLLYTHFSYVFMHVSIYHLFINSFFFVVVSSMLDDFKFLHIIEKYITPYLSCVVASFLCNKYDIPTCGSSGMTYAMIGAFISIAFFSNKTKIVDKKKFGLYLFILIFGLVMSCLNTFSNFLLHLLSFLISFIAITIIVFVFGE